MKNGATPGPDGQSDDQLGASWDSRLRERLIDRRSEEWSVEDASLWDRFLDELETIEIGRFTQQSAKTAARARRLFQRAKVFVNTTTGELCVSDGKSKRPKHEVPVLLMYMDGTYRVHPRVEIMCRMHPWILKDSPEDYHLGDRSSFLAQLEKLREVEREARLSKCGFINHVQLAQGPLRRASACSVELLYLEIFLDHTRRDSLDVDEPLDWLETAKNCRRFWLLLNAAFRAGRALEAHQILSDPSVQRALEDRTLQPPGKKRSLEGEALEELILHFKREHPDIEPNPLPIMKWLNGKPGAEDEPPAVDHPAWPPSLREIPWKRFKSLFKSTKKQMKKSS